MATSASLLAILTPMSSVFVPTVPNIKALPNRTAACNVDGNDAAIFEHRAVAQSPTYSVKEGDQWRTYGTVLDAALATFAGADPPANIVVYRHKVIDETAVRVLVYPSEKKRKRVSEEDEDSEEAGPKAGPTAGPKKKKKKAQSLPTLLRSVCNRHEGCMTAKVLKEVLAGRMNQEAVDQFVGPALPVPVVAAPPRAVPAPPPSDEPTSGSDSEESEEEEEDESQDEESDGSGSGSGSDSDSDSDQEKDA